MTNHTLAPRYCLLQTGLAYFPAVGKIYGQRFRDLSTLLTPLPASLCQGLDIERRAVPLWRPSRDRPMQTAGAIPPDNLGGGRIYASAPS
jgi:hypothetical protein